MTNKSLEIILALTNEIKVLKYRHKALSRVVLSRFNKVKNKLEQLNEPAYEWDFKD